ncbi:hypothetical protein D9Q98_005024 [Chlorella vulgaris]|uniref:Nudix hydrolase domain-containing protein n=1 Tax=Chlorella vulgaris TaxID=3077 RepID=A0A9D4TPM5_CHLVU|nr:hypothetical protein D9Q98_005024 [Chlorella vulgaris]
MSSSSKFSYQYPRPSLTVDAVIVTGDTEPQLLLIKRKNDPFAGSWALPGGFVDENEALEAAAARELQEETGVDPSRVLLTQVGAFGDPGRDPRGWCISVAYAALVPSSSELQIQAAEAQLYKITEQLPPLAFDHKRIVRLAFRHLARADAVEGQAARVQQLLAAADRLHDHAGAASFPLEAVLAEVLQAREGPATEA